MIIKVVNTEIPDVNIMESKIFDDCQGFFMDAFRNSWFWERVAEVNFVQHNHSKSTRSIIRGLHYQTERMQGKLVRVITGELFDVAVDIRGALSDFWAMVRGCPHRIGVNFGCPLALRMVFM